MEVKLDTINEQVDLIGKIPSEQININKRRVMKDSLYYRDRPFKCTKCRKAFKKKRQLTAHMKSAHKGNNETTKTT